MVAVSIAQISPGKLSRRHIALEGISNCTSCHELGQSASPVKCLQCHVSLRSRMEAGAGYHASPEVAGKLCFKCHSEHHGVDYPLVKWSSGREKFNHDLTGFKLEGAHAGKDCAVCHRPPFNRAVTGDQSLNPGRTLLGLKKECIACHVDEHQGQLGGECLKCHTQDKWKPAVKFDHSAAKFPLTGRHNEIACARCHRSEKAAPPQFEGALAKREGAGSYAIYRNLPYGSCLSCHQDVHKGKFGSDCEKCHSTAGFGLIIGAQFDHSKTGYPLSGKHSSVACAKCHTGSKTGKLKFAACRDCHKDEHRGQFASRPDKGACESCHSVAGFLPARYPIEEHQQSRYPLTGGHLATPCIACHSDVKDSSGVSYARFDFPDRSCHACHGDPHRGEANRWLNKKGCEECHSTESWQSVSFDHARARFPLEGKHRTTECGGCHRVVAGKGKALRLAPLETACGDCHLDFHRGQLTLASESGGADCSRCHTPAGWRWLRFDHNRDSRFKLEGFHAKISCDRCHLRETTPDGETTIRFKPLGTQCSDCHKGKG